MEQNVTSLSILYKISDDNDDSSEVVGLIDEMKISEEELHFGTDEVILMGEMRSNSK